MKDELLKALQLIKEECKKHVHCDGCPMMTCDGMCGISENEPKSWLLEKREVYF